MIGALFVGALVGAAIGGGRRTVVHRSVSAPSPEIDYRRLGHEVARAQVEEAAKARNHQIYTRLKVIDDLFSDRAMRCAGCGGLIKCVRFIVGCADINVEDDPPCHFVFACDCIEQRVDCKYVDIYGAHFGVPCTDRDCMRIKSCTDTLNEIMSEAHRKWCGGDKVNCNRELFHQVFETAYSKWRTQADMMEERGDDPLSLERKTLEKELNQPVALASGVFPIQ